MADGLDEFDTVTRTTSREQEEAAFEQLGRLFQVIDRWQEEDEQRSSLTVRPGSSLAGDDQGTNPYHLSHAVLHGIAGAIDHLHALRMLVQKASSLHTFAPFTLNRAAIEAAAVAVWLLAPRTRDERIRRRLTLATQNARDGGDIAEKMGKSSALDKRLNEIRKVAGRRPALDPNGIVGSPPGMERIIREAGEAFELGGTDAVAFWKSCSGITHNRTWATVALLDREELRRIANVRNLRVTASFSNVLSVTTISVVFSAEARRLFDLHS